MTEFTYNEPQKEYIINTFKYDDKGNCVEDTYSTSEGIVNQRTYKYDDKGNYIEKNVYEGNKLIEYYETQITYWE